MEVLATSARPHASNQQGAMKLHMFRSRTLDSLTKESRAHLREFNWENHCFL